MTQFGENPLILFVAVLTCCFVCFGEENIENSDFSFLYKCDWDVYNNTQILHETQVKSRIKCAAICLQYQTGCLGFELYKSSVTSCRFFREDMRKNCVQPSMSASYFYRRTTPAITNEVTTTTEAAATTVVTTTLAETTPATTTTEATTTLSETTTTTETATTTLPETTITTTAETTLAAATTAEATPATTTTAETATTLPETATTTTTAAETATTAAIAETTTTATPTSTAAATTTPATTTAATTSSPCQNGGTLNAGICSCVFGCFGQYCQTCINECKDATGVSGLGIAWIKPNGFDVAKKVWCNFDFGVTYLQIREFGNVNFNRSYAEYENGFGDANGDYWLGNKYAHIVSNLRYFNSGFTLKKATGGQTMITYFNFIVLDSTSNYAVQYSSVNTPGYPLANGQPFQAYDTASACAQTLGCGWWFGSTCSSGSPNGPYPVTYGIYTGATTTRIGLF